MNKRCDSILLLMSCLIIMLFATVHGRAASPLDDDQLKAHLMGEFLNFEGYDRDNTCHLKASGVTDEQLRRVLMAIYEESETTLARSSNQYERMASTLRRENAIGELGRCANEGTKDYLLDLVADKSKEGVIRTIAFSSFLRNADADEVRDALIRFLISEERMDSQARSSILAHAAEIYRESEIAKKRAIIESLYVALAHDDAK